MTTHAAAGLSIGSVIELINAVAMFAVVLAVGFSLVGIVAVWRAGREGAHEFFRMFERLQVLQLLTVMLVIAAATVLALLGLLNSNGITGILSGVAGYVLGGLGTPAKGAVPTASPVPASHPASTSPGAHP
jgi:hypothetical protein